MAAVRQGPRVHGAVPAGCNRWILLKNSSTSHSATFSEVVRSSTDGRSSILGRSEKSRFRGDRSFDCRVEFFNRIQQKLSFRFGSRFHAFDAEEPAQIAFRRDRSAALAARIRPSSNGSNLSKKAAYK